jgi:hypothetical protein
MPQQTKIFRVFVSSTFTDMKEERRILQKKVFPALEKYCEKNNARFQGVDLRWGVNEESQLNQKTLDICLNEIARCQRISPKPNFLILMGDKYGWQPVLTKIPETEWDTIQTVMNEEGKKIIHQWYKKDSNAIPSEYVLQPRGNAHKEYRDWEVIEKKIRVALRKAVNQLSLSPEQRIKYFASATHQEIVAGALKPKEISKKPEEHVFAFIRQTDGMPDDGSAEGFIDIENEMQDPYCRGHLINLKEELKSKIGNHSIPYPAKWKNGKTSIVNPEDFEKKIYDFLEGLIKEQLKETISSDEIDHEIKLHREFKENLTEHFCGRQEILENIHSYLNNSNEKRPLAIIGDSGSGKSSVMARAIQVAEDEMTNYVLVYRFIGTTSESSGIINLLQSICGQVASSFNTTLEALAGEGREKSLYDINGMTEVFKKCLALSTAQKPVIIFLDALDQLSDTDNAISFYWLPKELPENARLVVSALPELETPLSGNYLEHLPILPQPEAEQILERWFQSVKRRLSEEQQNEVIGKFNHTSLPIYLKLAFEHAKHWYSYTTDFTLKNDVKGIINSFIDLLEEEHTEDFVRDVICLMLCGRYQGLAENEILEIFAFDEKLWEQFLARTHEDHRNELVEMKKELEEEKKAMKIPIVVMSRLFLDLEPYLTERDADGVPIITFFHRQFNKVLRERYQLDEEKEIERL